MESAQVLRLLYNPSELVTTTGVEVLASSYTSLSKQWPLCTGHILSCSLISQQGVKLILHSELKYEERQLLNRYYEQLFSDLRDHLDVFTFPNWSNYQPENNNLSSY